MKMDAQSFGEGFGCMMKGLVLLGLLGGAAIVGTIWIICKVFF